LRGKSEPAFLAYSHRMLTLHLVRHGDTEASGDGVFCGDLDAPLTQSGMAQAQKVGALAERLRPEALYVSPKRRALQTVDPAARLLKLEPTIDEGLREIGYGTWEGRKEVEIREREPDAYWAWVRDPALHPPPGGEGGFAIAARAMTALGRLQADHAKGVVLVVSHKATIRVMTCALLGLHIGRFRDRVACPTASLTTFEFGERGAMLVRIGDTTHLH
jgi:broad specificity phosphatase PhoE